MIAHYIRSFLLPRQSNETISKYFSKKHIPFKIGHYKADGRWVRYLETGDNTKPLVLFLHGAPGSCSVFLPFLSDSSLLKEVHMIAIDRPGYGYSCFGESIVSVKQQAALIRPVLKKNNAGKDKLPILVGHSYGATIAVRMAMDYPADTGPLILLAPPVNPAIEKIYKASYLANYSLFKKLLPTALRVTNDEKMAHVAELNKMLTYWHTVKNPVTVIHGCEDHTVPVENAVFLEKQLMHTSFKSIAPPDLSHLIPWEKPDLIKKEIKNYLV